MAKRKKYIYLIVIGIGVAALLADRLLLGGEASGPASAQAGVPQAVPAVTGSRSVETAASVPELHFPRNLPTYEPSRPLRDLFAAPVRFAERAPAGPVVKFDRFGRRIEDEHTAQAAFVERHTLTAVLVQRDVQIAVVDDAWLRVGDELEGFRLEAIEGEIARFRGPDGAAELRVRPPG